MPGQQRGLLPVQFRGVDAEVGLGGVLDAERAVAERHQVEVAGEDLGLGERLVQRQRHPDLAQLARRGGLDGGTLLGVGLRDHQQLVVLHVLLLEGRAAAGVEVAGQVAGQAGQRALPVHAVVLGKPLVLDRDDRQLHGVGDLVAGHLEPSLRVQPGDDVALGVDHRRHLRAPRPRRAAPNRWRPRRRRGWTATRTRLPRETSAPRRPRWPAGSTTRA